MPKFLLSGRAMILTLLLVAEAVAFIAYPKQEIVLLPRPLSQLPVRMGSWTMSADLPLDQETLEMLKADDTLNRLYTDQSSGVTANLYIAFFKTQRTGVSPHSPKVCLPSSGWEPKESSFLSIRVPGRAEPIVVNHYIIARGDDKSVVLYWYQTHDKVIADEYRAKVNTVFDSMRNHRSDTSIVRVVVPMRPGIDADSEANRMAQQAFPEISRLLPR